MPDTLTHITTSGGLISAACTGNVREAGIAPDRYLYLPTIDDHPPSLEHLRQGVAFMTEEIEGGGGVFVHCGSGVGRAPTMAAAYLVSAGKTVDEAWRMIREKRPFVRPRPEQVAQVARLVAEMGE